jgi:hypothetical protein
MSDVVIIAITLLGQHGQKATGYVATVRINTTAFSSNVQAVRSSDHVKAVNLLLIHIGVFAKTLCLDIGVPAHKCRNQQQQDPLDQSVWFSHTINIEFEGFDQITNSWTDLQKFRQQKTAKGLKLPLSTRQLAQPSKSLALKPWAGHCPSQDGAIELSH